VSRVGRSRLPTYFSTTAGTRCTAVKTSSTLRLLHGDKPLVVTSAAHRPRESEEPGDPVVAPSRAGLAEAIERALRTPHTSAAEVRQARREVAAYHGPTW
jgi:hypothetical protein